MLVQRLNSTWECPQHCLHTVGASPGSEQPLCSSCSVKKRSFEGHVLLCKPEASSVASSPITSSSWSHCGQGCSRGRLGVRPFARVLAFRVGGVSRKSRSLGDPHNAGRKGRGSVDFVLSDDIVLVAASSSSSPRPVLLCLPLSQSIYK